MQYAAVLPTQYCSVVAIRTSLASLVACKSPRQAAEVVLASLKACSAHTPLRLHRRRELRSLVPEDLDCTVVHAAECVWRAWLVVACKPVSCDWPWCGSRPMLGAWKGAAVLAASGAYAQRSVSREEYLEHGHSICYKRFRLGGPA